MSAQSWISPKTEKGLPSKISGKGFFAKEDIDKGEIVAVKGGHLVDKKTLEDKRDVIQDSEMQITDDIWMVPLTSEELLESMVYVNHSCEPNMQFEGSIIITAQRDISPREELTIDYGLHFANPEFKLVCTCGSVSCRKTITGDDWKNPEFQQKNYGKFAWYIQRKINSLPK